MFNASSRCGCWCYWNMSAFHGSVVARRIQQGRVDGGKQARILLDATIKEDCRSLLVSLGVQLCRQPMLTGHAARLGLEV